MALFVRGHVIGPSTETVNQSCKFHVKTRTSTANSSLASYPPRDGDLPPPSAPELRVDFLFFRPVNALPTYCPWIEWDLIVDASGPTCIAGVLEILACRPRSVSKADLKEHILRKRGPNRTVAERERDKAWLDDVLSASPATIRSEDDLRISVMPTRRKRKGYRNLEKDEQQFVKAVWPRFEGPEMMALLPHFSATWIARFSVEQRAAIVSLVAAKPVACLFWPLAERCLRGISSAAGPPLFDPDDLKVSPRYACSHGKRLADDRGDLAWYVSKCPVWSVGRWLRYASRVPSARGEALEGVPDEVVGDAMRVYLFWMRMHYATGSFCVFPPRREPEFATDPLRLAAAVTLLKRLRIFREPAGTIAGGRLMLPEHELLEVEIADHLNRRTGKIVVVDCPYYNDRFMRLLQSAIPEWGKAAASSRGRAVVDAVYSANESTASYVRAATGRNVEFVDEMRVTRADLVVLDRANKIGPELFLRFLRNLASPDGFALVLIGDLNDFAARHARGGGNVLQDVAASGIARLEEWKTWADDDPMKPTYECLQDRSTADVSYCFLAGDPSEALRAHFSKLFDVNRKEEKKRLFFCSSSDAQALVAEALEAASPRAPSRTPIHVGQRINVVPLDFYGIIVRAWEGTYELGIKEEMDPSWRDYRVIVKDIAMRTIELKGKLVERADAIVAATYAGRAVDKGIFFAGEGTSLEEMMAMCKYCTLEMRIVFFPGSDLGSMKRKDMKRTTATDLACKLAVIGKGAKAW
jgi:hypothetical protein